MRIEQSKSINGYTFELAAERSKDQSSLFTPYHTRFDCETAIKDPSGELIGKVKFPYQCNVEHDKPAALDCMYSYFQDAQSYDGCRDEGAFLEEYGYLSSGRSAIEGIAAYKACRDAYDSLIEIFGNEDLFYDMYEKLDQYFNCIDEPDVEDELEA